MTEGNMAQPASGSASMAATGAGKRPGLVTLIAIYVFIVAVGDILQGVLQMILNGDATLQANLAADSTTILWTGIINTVIGVVIALVGLALLNGSGVARTLVAIAMGLRIVGTFGLFGLNVSLDETGAAWAVTSILHVLLPIFVLWALYGNDKVDAWFERAS